MDRKEFYESMFIKIESRNKKMLGKEEEAVTTEVADDPKRRDNKTDWIYKDTLFRIDSLLSKITRGNISTSAAK